MKKILLVALLLSLMSSVIFAQPGTTGLTFLQLGVGARSLAMGEAYSAIANDPSAMYYNPAAMSLSTSPQLLLMHKSWIQDTKTDYIAAQTYAGRFRFGVAVNSTGVDNIEYRTQPGPAEGTFTARNAAMGFSTSYSVNPALAIGATFNYLYEKIFVNDATGYGLNVGALYSGFFDTRFALSINNLGSMNNLDSAATTLPTSFRLGAARTYDMESIAPNSDLTFAAEYVSYTSEHTNHLHFGAELDYEHTFAMRAGYLTGYDARSVTAGIGVRYRILTVDYAYAPFSNDLGTTHTFSLGFDF